MEKKGVSYVKNNDADIADALGTSRVTFGKHLITERVFLMK